MTREGGDRDAIDDKVLIIDLMLGSISNKVRHWRPELWLMTCNL